MTNRSSRVARQSKWIPILASHIINSPKPTSKKEWMMKRLRSCKRRSSLPGAAQHAKPILLVPTRQRAKGTRSEERRVGKECRGRRSQEKYKEKEAERR